MAAFARSWAAEMSGTRIPGITKAGSLEQHMVSDANLLTGPRRVRSNCFLLDKLSAHAVTHKGGRRMSAFSLVLEAARRQLGVADGMSGILVTEISLN